MTHNNNLTTPLLESVTELSDYIPKCSICDKQQKKALEKTVFKKWIYVKIDKVPDAIINWARRNNQPLSNKQEIAKCITTMRREGYNSRLWMRDLEWIYCKVMLKVNKDMTPFLRLWKHKM